MLDDKINNYERARVHGRKLELSPQCVHWVESITLSFRKEPEISPENIPYSEFAQN